MGADRVMGWGVNGMRGRWGEAGLGWGVIGWKLTRWELMKQRVGCECLVASVTTLGWRA